MSNELKLLYSLDTEAHHICLVDTSGNILSDYGALKNTSFNAGNVSDAKIIEATGLLGANLPSGSIPARSDYPAPPKGSILRISSSGVQKVYPSPDPDDLTTSGNPNGTQLIDAAANVENGDTVVIGPGVYYATDLSFTANNLTLVSYADLIIRPNETDSVFVLRFIGNDVDIHLNHTKVDNNRANNLSARSGTNEHNGIELNGDRIRLFDGEVKNIGYFGIAIESPIGAGKLTLDSVKVRNGGYSCARLRGTEVRMRNCIFIEPDEFDLPAANIVANEAAANALGLDLYEGTYWTSDKKFYIQTASEVWTSTAGNRRFTTCDGATGGSVCELFEIIGCQFLTDYYGHLVIDADAYDVKNFVVDNILISEGVANPDAVQGTIKLDYVRNTVIKNTIIKGPNHKSVQIVSTNNNKATEYTFENCRFDGIIDQNSERANRFSVIKSSIGDRDMGTISHGLKDIRTNNLQVIDSRISGGAIYGIYVDGPIETDKIEVRNSSINCVIAPTSGSTGYALLNSASDFETNNIIYENNTINACEGGYATAGAASTITAPSNFSATLNAYKGRLIEIIHGPGSGDIRTITGSSTDRVLTVDSAFSATPTTDTYFRVYHYHYGWATAGAPLAVALDTFASATRDVYNGLTVKLLFGPGKGESKTISDYTGEIGLTLANAVYTHTGGGVGEKQLVLASAFADYTWASGDQIYLYDATGGVAEGVYEIASREDANTILLAADAGLTADATGVDSIDRAAVVAAWTTEPTIASYYRIDNGETAMIKSNNSQKRLQVSSHGRNYQTMLFDEFALNSSGTVGDSGDSERHPDPNSVKKFGTLIGKEGDRIYNSNFPDGSWPAVEYWAWKPSTTDWIEVP